MSTDALRPSSRAARALVGVLVLVGLAVALEATSGAGASARQAPERGEQLVEDDQLVERGADLFGTHCAICHGELGRGVPITGPQGGPPLQGVGAAAVDFMLRTGRMPMDNAQDRLERHPPRFDDEERRALIAFVESLPGDGPDIPDIEGWEQANLSRGLDLYTTHCVACHGPTAQGVAVGQRDVSASLHVAEPIEIATAVRAGPGVMPRFLDDTVSEEDLRAVTAWIMDLRERESPGGWSFGRSGTVAEGFLAIAVGLGLLTIVMYLLGERARDENAPGVDDEEGGREHL